MKSAIKLNRDEQISREKKILELKPKLKARKKFKQKAGINWWDISKHSLTFSDGRFRTPLIESTSMHNALNAKEKGFLDIEEPLNYQENPELYSERESNPHDL